MSNLLFKSKVFSVILFGAISLASAPAMAVSILINGGFEEPASVLQGTYNIFTSIPGWTTTSGAGIEIQDHVAGDPITGEQFVELDSDNNSGMQQIISTVPRGKYQLSFQYSPRPNIAANSNGIRVFFNNVLIDEITENGQSKTLWSSHSYDLTASGTSSILAFQAIGISDSFGGYLDDVQLAAILRAPGAEVPEPSSLVLLGCALFLFYAQRRRNS